MTKSWLARWGFLGSFLLLASHDASAWFFFFPGSAISRALEKDPEKIEVSSKDRLVGKCAGLHVNQTNSRGKSAEEMTFHRTMAEKTVELAENKDKTKELAEAYSAKWSRAAAVDRNTNRAYGADLAGGCRSIGLPITLAEQKQDQARREQEARAQEEAKRNEEGKRLEEARQRQEAKQEPVGGDVKQAASIQSASPIDFNAEARKAARILGCTTSDLRVTGVESKNVVFVASCENGGPLTLSCDPTGLCLKNR